MAEAERMLALGEGDRQGLTEARGRARAASPAQPVATRPGAPIAWTGPVSSRKVSGPSCAASAGPPRSARTPSRPSRTRWCEMCQEVCRRNQTPGVRHRLGHLHRHPRSRRRLPGAGGARVRGWDSVPMICSQEIPVPGSMPRVIRGAPARRLGGPAQPRLPARCGGAPARPAPEAVSSGRGAEGPHERTSRAPWAWWGSGSWAPRSPWALRRAAPGSAARGGRAARRRSGTGRCASGWWTRRSPRRALRCRPASWWCSARRWRHRGPARAGVAAAPRRRGPHRRRRRKGGAGGAGPGAGPTGGGLRRRPPHVRRPRRLRRGERGQVAAAARWRCAPTRLPAAVERGGRAARRAGRPRPALHRGRARRRGGHGLAPALPGRLGAGRARPARRARWP